MRLPPLTLVLGHTASGKSAFAERLVRQSGLAKTYFATAEPSDAQMQATIAQHRSDRAGHGWRTVEAPRDLPRALSEIEDGEVALVDCITFWLSNHVHDDGDWEAALDLLLDVLDHVPAPVVLVSNEVAGDLMPDTAKARAFCRAQGRVNQALAAEADLVVQVTAGLPAILKGADALNEAHDADDLRALLL